MSIRDVLKTAAWALAFLVVAVFLPACASPPVAHGISYSTPEPVEGPSWAQLGGVSRAFHGSISCVAGGTVVDLKGAQEIFAHNYTADILYIYERGGNATKTSGLPICNDTSTCTSWVKLPSGSRVWECASATGTVTLNLLGVAQ